MPMYQWKNKKTGRVVQIIRQFSDYENPPTKEEITSELGEEGEETDAEGDWEREICVGVSVNKSNNWGPGKGNW